MTDAPQHLLDRFLADHPDVPGVLVHLSGRGFSWSGAAGVRDARTAEPLTPDATYRIASITKTFVAAAVLRSMELGRLSLDDPMGSHLDDGPLRTALGERRCAEIRIRHLLTHMSGLPDFVEDTEYQALALGDLQRRWTRLQQVELALTLDDVADVGTTFHYSDTGYVVLGEIVERTTGVGLAESLRALLDFEGLGLSATYTETLEAVPADAGPRAHQYTDGVDTFDVHPSFDLWGGGGLVSSTADVATFFRALFNGRVFEQPSTLDAMTETAAEAQGAHVGMGIAGRDMGGHRLWGHGGYWGVYSGYVADVDVALSVAVLERNALGAVATELLPAVLEAGIACVEASAVGDADS